MKKKYTNTSFRLYDDTPQKLTELAQESGMSKSKYFDKFIEEQYQLLQARKGEDKHGN